MTVVAGVVTGAGIAATAVIVEIVEIVGALVEDLHREALVCLAAPVDLVARAGSVVAVDSPAVPVVPRVDFPLEVVGLRAVFLVVRRGWVAVVATAEIAAVALVR